MHSDEAAGDIADSLRANAFTTGRHIVFGHGKFEPSANEGRRLLAHELVHTIQQRAVTGSATGLIQRDAAAEKEVERVISPTVEMRRQAVADIENQLDKRMEKRKAEIRAMLDDLGPNPKSKSAKLRAEALKRDLEKDLATVIKEPDSRFVDGVLRKDVKDSAHSLDTLKLNLKSAEAKWSRFDPIFASKEVAAALGKDTLTAAELKALIAKESGDLTENDLEGDIAGIAQLSEEEEKKSGGKPGDRKVPEKAILLAAKTMARIASQLDSSLSVAPDGTDRKKFIMAAYNAGPNAIVMAQKEAIKLKKDGKTWQALIDGGKQSGLHKGIADTYQPGKVEAKFVETTNYITKIFARLP